MPASDIAMPIKVMIAVLLGLGITLVVVIALANSGAFGASGSTALITTNSDFIDILPALGMMVAGGFVLIALGNRR